MRFLVSGMILLFVATVSLFTALLRQKFIFFQQQYIHTSVVELPTSSPYIVVITYR